MLRESHADPALRGPRPARRRPRLRPAHRSARRGRRRRADAAGERRKPTELDKVEVVGERADGYAADTHPTATKTDTPLQDVPQAITVVTQRADRDQAMQGMADVMRYVPGVGMAQGEGNRDTPVLRGNSSTADMFIDGMRDDVQYFRDLYNIDRVEALKGPNAMIFGRGGSGGVLNRVSKQADWNDRARLDLQLGSWNRGRAAADYRPGAINDNAAFRLTALIEDTDSFRDDVDQQSAWGVNPTLALQAGDSTTITLGYEHFEDERTADRGVPSRRRPYAGADRPIPRPSSATRRAADVGRRRCLRRCCSSTTSTTALHAAQPHPHRRTTTSSTRTCFPGAVFADGTGRDLGLQQRHAAREHASTRPT